MFEKNNLQVLLSSRPKGKPTKNNFLINHSSIPSPKDGEVLIKTIYLSLDPYMRGRMNSGKSYANPQEIGQVMIGGTVGKVIDSKNSDNYIKLNDAMKNMNLLEVEYLDLMEEQESIEKQIL